MASQAIVDQIISLDLIHDELDLKIDSTKFYTDSKVVLGYIYNESRHFYVYVHNRVQRIRQTARPEQWNYVCTEDNPADHASRSVPASLLAQTTWFTGPYFLLNSPNRSEPVHSFNLVEPELDMDVRPTVRSCATKLQEKGLNTERFQRFSSFNSLVRAIALLIHIARSYNLSNSMDMCKDGISVICLALQKNYLKRRKSSSQLFIREHSRRYLKL